MSTARPDILDALADDDLQIEGRLVDASNATLRCQLVPSGQPCVYKPVRGERPLWDFPNGTLAQREVAAYELSALAGWDVIPPTTWRTDGPAGAGMCQAWIETGADTAVVDIVSVNEQRPGWVSVLSGEDGHGRDVHLIHEMSERVQRIAVLDVIINNADRKGGHLLVDTDQRLWAIDHGVCFAVEDKLRTVLWGWAGEEIPAPLLAEVDELRRALASERGERVLSWLHEDECDALFERTDRLLTEGRLPLPRRDGPAVPWPVL